MAWIGSLLGVAVALVPVALAMRDDGLAAFGSGQFVVTSLLLLVAGFVLPRWITRVMWRRRKIRHSLSLY